MLDAVLADITTQVDHLTQDELRRKPLSASPRTRAGENLVPLQLPASTPFHRMTPLKCLPNQPAGHER